MQRDADLHEYLAEKRREKFEPGINDCATFVGGWVKSQTGLDLTQGLVGKYSKLSEGRDRLKKLGFADHIDIAVQNFEEIYAVFAQVGDIAVIDNNAFGIVGGERVFVLMPHGIGSVEIAQAQRAFRLP